MRLTLITAATAEPVSVAELKAFARIDHEDEDVLLTELIRTARQALDGRAGLLGRALVSQTWRLALDRFPAVISLPLPPARSVDEIAITAPDGTTTVLAAGAYLVEGLGDDEPATIRPAAGAAWPATAAVPGAVRVTFQAGYGEAEDVPEPIRNAIREHATFLYEMRGEAPREPFETLSRSYAQALAPYRLWGV